MSADKFDTPDLQMAYLKGVANERLRAATDQHRLVEIMADALAGTNDLRKQVVALIKKVDALLERIPAR